MKNTAALFLGLTFLFGGKAIAAEPGAFDASKLKRTVAFEPATQQGTRPARSLPGARSLETASCGAYVSNGKQHGYGFGFSKAVATGKAHEMCGPNACQVVVAACED